VAAACEDSELLIIPVDMPRLQVSLLRQLCDAEPDVGCVRFVDHILPMRLRLDARCRNALTDLMRADERSRSLRALQERVGVREIFLAADQATQLLDCNTEATWREANA
jgi:molybdopterin-guanine dinucleotide biosynthesis protein A